MYKHSRMAEEDTDFGAYGPIRVILWELIPMCVFGTKKSHSSACAASLKAWSYSKNGRTNGNVLSLSALRVSCRSCPGVWWIHWSTSACRENVSPVLHTMSSVTDSFVTVATFLYEHIMCAWLYAHTHCIVLHPIVTHISSLCDLKYVKICLNWLIWFVNLVNQMLVRLAACAIPVLGCCS